MNLAIKTALERAETIARQDLEGRVQSELGGALEKLRLALNAEAEFVEKAVAKRGPEPIRRVALGEGSSTRGMRAVLERAWAADPLRTELDLLDAGREDLVSDIGAWWEAECYRQGIPRALSRKPAREREQYAGDDEPTAKAAGM